MSVSYKLTKAKWVHAYFKALIFSKNKTNKKQKSKQKQNKTKNKKKQNKTKTKQNKTKQNKTKILKIVQKLWILIFFLPNKVIVLGNLYNMR